MKFILKLMGLIISASFAFYTVSNWENFFIFTIFLSSVSCYRIVAHHWIADIERDFFAMILTYMGTYLGLLFIDYLQRINT